MQNTITPDNVHSFCLTCLHELQTPKYNIQKMDAQIRTWVQDPLPASGYPIFVCHLCRDKLEYFLEFHKVCLRSRRVLQDILELKPNKKVLDVESRADSYNGDYEMDVNCDWLDFDFIAISKAHAELQRKKYVVAEATKNNELTSNTGSSKSLKKENSHEVSNNSNNSDKGICRLECEQIKIPSRSKDASENKSEASVCDDNLTASDDSNDLLSNIVRKSKSRTKRTKKSCRHGKVVSRSEKTANQHVCEECGKVFEKYKQLEKHQFTHKPPEEHPFYCAECNKIYKSQQTYKEHQLRHSGIKNFECPYCGVKKTTKNELQTHLNYHTKERQYLCPNCPMIFSRVSNFRRHFEVVHQGIKRYICRYCDQAFGKPNTLKHHEMIHTGEKPHECNECGKRFRQQVQLTTHMKVHNKQLKQPNFIQKEYDLY